MESPISNIFQSYTATATSMLEQWSALASKSASKMDAGAYDAASAAEDAIAGTTLAAEGAWLWTAWACEAFAKLYGLEAGPNIAESQPFPAAKGASLKLAGPLAKGPGLDRLPASAVTIEPEQLGPDEEQFVLRANGSGYRGATYVGLVEATTAAGTEVVPVWVTIP